MKKNYRTLLSATLLLVALSGGLGLKAQTVAYPAAIKPSTAHLDLNTSTQTYKFSNELLDASFVLTDGKLSFAGSEALGLLPGDDLFQVTMGNGTIVNSSKMKATDVRIESITGRPDAVRGADRFSGQALKANFAYGNLRFAWTALLRDGSHYITTELELTAKANTGMRSIEPMLYTVSNKPGNTVPVPVGNTRGAIIASNKIFAGLETPLGINTAGTVVKPVQDIIAKDFNFKAWKQADFSPAVPKKIPAGITALGYPKDKMSVYQGYVSTAGGETSFTFKYVGGPHRLNIAGVDLVKEGVVVASDYHKGFTGTAKENNVYKLNIKEKGNYLLRYFVETQTETIDSYGTITVEGGKIEQSYLVQSTQVDWSPTDWKAFTGERLPQGISDLNFSPSNIRIYDNPVSVTMAGKLETTFTYATGTHRLNLVGAELLLNGSVIGSDYHVGNTGTNSMANTYSMDVAKAGEYTLRYYAEEKSESINSTGTITLGLDIKAEEEVEEVELPKTTPLKGLWSRNTTLKVGETWKVSAVVGLIAEGQARRSVLAYSERERAVPWRSFPLYNSWYELNIDRNNDPDPFKRMTESQCIPVVKAWYENLYKKHGQTIKTFVWDDGWDDFNSLWAFHKGFPNGFKKIEPMVKEMDAENGVWLGPVGGYGSAKGQRLAYWNRTYHQNVGNLQLSNDIYFKAFTDRCSDMIKNDGVSYFKFDGISDKWSATGPGNEEDAEGIIRVLTQLRKTREDVFFNTTVGTWASPFFFHYSDAVWRQENDFGQEGDQGNAREKWITYRDRLVYQNFVQNSPLCPINSMMTHGLMVTKHGQPSWMRHDNTAATRKEIVREMRCAFASGTNMVELYLDNDIMTNIQNGALWGDLAECIKWHKDNSDVLADTHWVGGNPWDRSKNRGEVYGWASWNEHKGTLALRNPMSSGQKIVSTMRKILDIPAYIKGSITISPAFASQTNIPILNTKNAIDIDKELHIIIPAFDVVVYDVKASADLTAIASTTTTTQNSIHITSTIQGVTVTGARGAAQTKLYNVEGKQVANFAIAKDGTGSTSLSQKGIYLVQVQNDNGTTLKSQKIVF